MSALTAATTAEPDPIFAAIERSRRAELAYDAEENPPRAVSDEAVESAHALAHMRATTRSGLAALASYFYERRTLRNCPFFDEIEDAEAFATNLSAAINRELGSHASMSKAAVQS